MKGKYHRVIMLLLILLAGTIFMMGPSIIPVQAGSINFIEDFSTKDFIDSALSNATGWGKGEVSTPKQTSQLVSTFQRTIFNEYNDIAIKGDVAFIYDWSSSDDLEILNISDPKAITRISGRPMSSSFGGLHLDGDFLYTSWDEWWISTSSFKYHIRQYNISDVNNIFRETTIELSYGVNDMVVDGGYVYVNTPNFFYQLNFTNKGSLGQIVGLRSHEGGSAIAKSGETVFVGNLFGIDPLNISDYQSGYPQIGGYVSAKPYGIAVDGNFGYWTTSSGMHIGNTTELSFQNPLSSLALPNPTPRDIEIVGQRAYILNLNDGVVIVDITDRLNPYIVETIQTPDPRDFEVYGDYIYIVDGDKGMMVYRLGQSFQPAAADFIWPSTGFYKAEHVWIDGDVAYVTDKSTKAFMSYNISNPKDIRLLQRIVQSTGGGYGIVRTYGNYLFATYDFGLFVYDVENPANMQQLELLGVGSIRGMVIKDRYLYAAHTSSDGLGTLDIYDIVNPRSPLRISRTELKEPARSTSGTYELAVDGGYAYVVGYIDQGIYGVTVVDIKDPKNPYRASTITTTGLVTDVSIDGNFMYLAQSDKGMVVVDITEPYNVKVITEFMPTSFTSGQYIDVDGDMAILASLDGIAYINVSQPTNPTEIGVDVTSSFFNNFQIDYDYAYFATDNFLMSAKIRSQYNEDYNTTGVFIAQSTDISSLTDSTIETISLTATSQVLTDTNIDYYVSTDVDGLIWQLVSSGTQIVVSGVSNLRWRAVFTTSNVDVSAILSNLSIDYTKILSTTPTLETPTDTKILAANNPILNWTDVIGAVNYQINIARDTGFTNSLITAESGISQYDTTADALTDGVWFWKVAGIDGDLDLGPFSQIFSFEIDTTDPTLSSPVDIVTEWGDTGSITWNVDDVNPHKYMVKDNANVVLESNIWSSGTISYNFGLLAKGSHSFKLIINDTLGNSISDTVEVTVSDTTKPTVTAPADVSSVEGSTGNIISWTAIDLDADTYTISVDSVIVVTATSWISGVAVEYGVDGWSIGIYTVEISFRDLSGNLRNDTVILSVADAIYPIITSPSDISYEEDTTGHSISWTPSDTNPGVYTIEVNEVEKIAITNWLNGADISFIVDGLSYGENNITIILLDLGGNRVVDTVIVTVDDNNLPTITSPSDLSYVEGSTNIEIKWTGTDKNPSTYSIKVDGVEVLTSLQWISGTQIIYIADGMSIGTHIVVITLKDLAGNAIDDSVTITVTQELTSSSSTSTSSTPTSSSTATSSTTPASSTIEPGKKDSDDGFLPGFGLWITFIAIFTFSFIYKRKK